ncbi:MAG: response regulator [Clostridia bacterium]|jgi:two-component system response regulator VicR|nr:response regulator transcription factor [Clostridium sp.]MEE0268643.1 response regulator [Clostridia bacterium]
MEFYKKGGTFVEGETSTDKKTILIVDDEQPIIDMLVYNLEKEGYNTLEATDGEKAVDIALNNTPDLILLDIMIPKMDGLSVCKRIRHTLNVPIIMLSAKGEEIDKILGLELGADDYITKPFSIRELMARIKANLRKGKGSYEDGKAEANTNKIIVGDLQLDVDKFETRVKNKVIDLTLREFEVLKYLANQLGQVVTRETLLEKVWGYEYYGDIRTVDVTVRRIREKIEEDTSNPKILITKRGVGYYIATGDK